MTYKHFNNLGVTAPGVDAQDRAWSIMHGLETDTQEPFAERNKVPVNTPNVQSLGATATHHLVRPDDMSEASTHSY